MYLLIALIAFLLFLADPMGWLGMLVAGLVIALGLALTAAAFIGVLALSLS